MNWNAVLIIAIMLVGMLAPRYISKMNPNKQKLLVSFLLTASVIAFLSICYALQVPLIIIVGSLVLVATLCLVYKNCHHCYVICENSRIFYICFTFTAIFMIKNNKNR